MHSSAVYLASLATCCALAAAAPAAAQDNAVTLDGDEEAIAQTGGDEITAGSSGLREFTTDRPDVTESPFTVDPGHVQIETTLLGYTRSRKDAAGVVTDTYEFGTTNVRIGVTERLEVNVVWQPYGIVDARGGGVATQGVGSVDLRAKLNLWGNEGASAPGDTALALLPYVTLPTDRNNQVGETEAAFGLIVPLAIEMGGGFGLGLNAAVNFSRPDRATPYDAAVLTSASLGYTWMEGLGSYAEVVWEFSRGPGAGDIVSLNTGMTIGLGTDWQLDMGVNVGASSAADPLAPFLGISARF